MESKDDDKPALRLPQRCDEEAYVQARNAYRSLVAAEIRGRIKELSMVDFQDIEQAIWIAVWKSLPTYQGTSTLPTWITGIAKNKCFSWLRQKMREQVRQSRIEAEPWMEGSFEVDLPNHLTLQTAIASLIPAEKEVITLRYFEGLADSAISRHLNLPLGTVKARIRAGIVDLRHSM